jgi:hypothetical protein
MRAIPHGEKRVLQGVVRGKQAPKTQRLAKPCHGESHEACLALRGMHTLTDLACDVSQGSQKPYLSEGSKGRAVFIPG